MRTKALLLVIAVALVTAASASAKMVPRFDRATATPGTWVRVFVPDAKYYRLPLRFYLIPARGKVTRTPIATFTRAGRVAFTFRVPNVKPGRYTVETWFRGTITGAWNHYTAAGAG